MARKVIGTSTAAFCVFDREALTHRLADSCDWWSIERDELAEVNAGNCLIFGTGTDGGFEVDVTEGRGVPSPDVAVVIRAPSGKIYLGAGEGVLDFHRVTAEEVMVPMSLITAIPLEMPVSSALELSRVCGPGLRIRVPPVGERVDPHLIAPESPAPRELEDGVQVVDVRMDAPVREQPEQM